MATEISDATETSSEERPRRRRPLPLALVVAMRPHQWVKNVFVGAPLLFSKSLLNLPQDLRAAAAVGLFCLLSSAVYLWNDVGDIEKDRAHPRKRLRPIPAGELPVALARAMAVALVVVGLGLGALLEWRFAATAAVYLALNLAYTQGLKRVPYVDVLILASGFLLRVLAGALAIHVEASPFLFICTGLLASFNGFGKRAHELATAGQRGGEQRAVLAAYRSHHLQAALWATGLATIAAYIMYTLAEHTRVFFGTTRMVWTVPCVAFGIARFMTLVSSRPKAESPTEEMLRDPPFVANLVVYVGVVVGIIYLAR